MKNQTSTTWRMGYQRFKDANRQKDARRWSAGMECSLPTGRDWWFPLPRPETHVGQLADSVWSTAFCSAGNGRMGEHRDGAPIRSPCAEPFNETREANWLDFRVMMSQICTIWKIRNLQKMDKLLKYNGTPCRIRTYDLRLRRPLLYPTELRAHCEVITSCRWIAWIIRSAPAESMPLFQLLAKCTNVDFSACSRVSRNRLVTTQPMKRQI